MTSKHTFTTAAGNRILAVLGKAEVGDRGWDAARRALCAEGFTPKYATRDLIAFLRARADEGNKAALWVLAEIASTAFGDLIDVRNDAISEEDARRWRLHRLRLEQYLPDVKAWEDARDEDETP